MPHLQKASARLRHFSVCRADPYSICQCLNVQCKIYQDVLITAQQHYTGLDYKDRTGIKICERNPNPKRRKQNDRSHPARSHPLQAFFPEKVQ